MLDIYILILLAVMAGGIGRTLYHFLFKVLNDPSLAFDKKYLITMLIAVLMTIMSTPLLLVNVEIPQGSEFFVLISMYSLGWFSNDLLNPPISTLSNIIEELRKKVTPS